MKVLMLSGDTQIINGIRGPFSVTLSGLSQYWEQIDIICPPSKNEVRHFSFNTTLYSKKINPIFHFFWSLYKVRRLIQESGKNYDLVISHDYGLMQNAIKAFILSKTFDIKWIGEVHHIEGFPKISQIKDILYRLCALIYSVFLTPYMSAVRTVNQTTTPKTLQLLGVNKDKIITLYSIYLDFETFKKYDVEKKYDLIYIGRLVPNKGIPLILETLSILKQESQQVSLLLVGKGPLKNQILDDIHKRNLKEQVHLIEWVEKEEDLALYINQSRFLICTSYAEGGPRTPLEALACGTPVLSTPVGIIPEVIKNNKNGHIINWNPQDIAKTLLVELQKNPYPVLTLQESVQSFHKDHILKAYAETYKNIISQ